MSDLVAQFTLLFTIIDPIGSVPVFIAVTAGVSPALRMRIALRAALVSLGVLLGFIIAGQLLLEALKIDLAAFRIAGGVILFLFALDMIFGMSKPDSERAEAERARQEALDLAVYPLAIPSIAGPGSIVAVVVLTDNHRNSVGEQAMTALLMAVVFGVTLACMLLADRIQRLIGAAGASIVSRVMGLITAAIAADGVLGGVRDYFGIAGA